MELAGFFRVDYMNFLIVVFLLGALTLTATAILPVFVIEEPEPQVLLFQEAREINEYQRNTFTTWRGYSINHNENGDSKISFEGDETTMMFAFTGTFGGQPITRTSRDFNWSWGIFAEDLNLFNRIATRYKLVGINDSARLPMTQSWDFYENNYPKLTYSINNNLGLITDAKFWFVHVLNKNDLVEFDGVKRLLSDNSFVRLTNINDREKIIRIKNSLGFDFSDLNKNGFEFTDLVLGKGEIIGKPDLVIAGIGVTKNNGVFPLGASVELDPTIFDTGERFALQSYNAQSDWAFIQNLKRNLAVPNRYATVTLTSKRVDLNQFGRPVSDGNAMLIPFGAEIQGIELIVSAKMISGLCGTPAELGTLDVLMAVDGALHSISKDRTWSCTEGETIKIYGSPTDLWGFNAIGDWNNMHFDYNHFFARITTISYANGGQWGPAPNAGVNFMKLKVYYSENCFFDPFNLDFFDCNCTQSISAQAGDIDLGDRIFNVINDDGNSSLEIRANLTNISKTAIETSCRVETFGEVRLS